MSNIGGRTLSDVLERVDQVRAAPLLTISDDDRFEFAVALTLQGYGYHRAFTMARELENNDGALQMLARHRITALGNSQ